MTTPNSQQPPRSPVRDPSCARFGTACLTEFLSRQPGCLSRKGFRASPLRMHYRRPPNRAGVVGILLPVTAGKGKAGYAFGSEESARLWRALSPHVHHVDPGAVALRAATQRSRGLHSGCRARPPDPLRGAAGAAPDHREHRHRRRHLPDPQAAKRGAGARLRDGAGLRVRVHPRRHRLGARDHHFAEPGRRTRPRERSPTPWPRSRTGRSCSARAGSSAGGTG